jgi:hypothetical protein
MKSAELRTAALACLLETAPAVKTAMVLELARDWRAGGVTLSITSPSAREEWRRLG